MSGAFVVHKFTVLPTEVQDIPLPQKFEMLHCDYQHGRVAFWYRCQPNAVLFKRRVAIVGTGAPCPGPDEADHIGTVLLHNGSLVLHAFLQKV